MYTWYDEKIYTGDNSTQKIVTGYVIIVIRLIYNFLIGEKQSRLLFT